eukprot:TRINITY_DN39170_c0_g1_i1.p1 TRINITY_DN39170_c0_g1~~TRINITY_DN39170_c0_g1_i1.p1  ORF type:complete len:570 (-),score=63.36 TRINITY_DN39170_c0_g1_i1:280-1923(-)
MRRRRTARVSYLNRKVILLTSVGIAVALWFFGHDAFVYILFDAETESSIDRAKLALTDTETVSSSGGHGNQLAGVERAHSPLGGAVLHESSYESTNFASAVASSRGEGAQSVIVEAVRSPMGGAVFLGPGCKGSPMWLQHEVTSFCQNPWRAVKLGRTSGMVISSEPFYSLRAGANEQGVAMKLELHSDCEGQKYWSTVMVEDGCVDVYTWPGTGSLRLVPRKIVKRARAAIPAPRYHIVASCESSRYQGYQAVAQWESVVKTRQAEKGGAFTRLLTAQHADDLSQHIPTFTAQRHPYSRRYGPFNKPDVLRKWWLEEFTTSNIIVIVDPDSWLVGDGDLERFLPHVKKGTIVAEFGVAGSHKDLWKRVCMANCERTPPSLAVPYLIHRDDLYGFANWSSYYTLLVHQLIDKKIEPEQGLGWMTEMAGFNFAAAHLGLIFQQAALQRRDVDPPGAMNVPFLHMGRVWFPSGKAGRWDQHELDWSGPRGIQVWCKCNNTADHIIPWPVPDGTDWVSRATLELLHGGLERVPVPRNPLYRPDDYTIPMM